MTSRRTGVPTPIDRTWTGAAALAVVLVAVACGKVSPTRSAESGGHPCAPPSVACGALCANIASDAVNCGACGAKCPSGDTCVDGACTSTGCPGAQSDCGGLCVDLNTNPLNCGACNKGCTPPEACTAGSCGCPAEDRVCGGVCTDIGASNEHCGACGRACAPDQLCKNGGCEPRCTPPRTFCDGRCVDLASDTTACGTCQTSCKTLESCINGQCECPTDPGHALCGGECLDLATNGNNCGSCGKVCSGGTVCDNGVCTSCTNGFFFCPSNTGDPLTTCLAQARSAPRSADGGGEASSTPLSPDLPCQCQHCLAELQDCVKDSQCVSAWQCGLAKSCTTPCWGTMGVCSMASGGIGGCWKFCAPSTGSTQAATRAEALLRCTRDSGCGI